MLKLVGYTFFLFVGYVIFCANFEYALFFEQWISSVPYRDKIGHFLLVGLLTFFSNFLTGFRRTKWMNSSFLLGTTMVVAFITLEEASQYFISNRTCDMVDLICSYLGIFFFERLSIWYNQLPLNQNI